MKRAKKVDAKTLLETATEGLLYCCYQVINNGKFPEESIIYDEEDKRPCLTFMNLASASDHNIRQFFRERPWLEDLIEVDYKYLNPIMYCKVYLKAKKQDYNFWYGYLLMKKNP